MQYGRDFEKMFQHDYRMVTVNVLFYVPGHASIVQEFLWQTLDLRPQYPRINRFLDYWRREIDAVIKEVLIIDMPDLDTKRWRHGVIIPIQ